VYHNRRSSCPNGGGYAFGGKAEPRFHPDSYGYRPKKAAWDAVGVCRQRCWKRDWVIDLDVEKFFDSVPWDLIVKAVRLSPTRPGCCFMSSGGCCTAAAPRRHSR